MVLTRIGHVTFRLLHSNSYNPEINFTLPYPYFSALVDLRNPVCYPGCLISKSQLPRARKSSTPSSFPLLAIFLHNRHLSHVGTLGLDGKSVSISTTTLQLQGSRVTAQQCVAAGVVAAGWWLVWFPMASVTT